MIETVLRKRQLHRCQRAKPLHTPILAPPRRIGNAIGFISSNLLETSVPNDYLSVGGTESISTGAASQDDLYRDAADKYGSSLERLASAWEADPEKRRDLSQDIHFQLWRSFQRYDARCSLRTWVYRVAHHVAASHVLRERRIFSSLVSLEELEVLPDKEQGPFTAGHIEVDQRRNLERLSVLIQQLKPLDRQVIVSYLEDMDAVTIGEITGLSPGNVAMKIHRIKNILARRFHEGGGHAK
jgi:RNA polymerase sigma-70 factor (ECF subfamily)